MKVDPTGRVRPTKTTVKTGKGRAGGASAFKVALEDAAAATAAPTSAPVTGVEPVDALLAIQEVDPGQAKDDRRWHARRRGERLLDQLDEIRLGLLSGGVAAGRLDEIAALVAEKRGSGDDPALDQVLDEIELRVKVELAKLGR